MPRVRSWAGSPPPRAVLLDADGTLFASEEPAFAASAEVTNAFLDAYGVSLRVAPEELRVATTGLTFRTTAVALCLAHGVPIDPGVPPAPALPSTYARRDVVARPGGPTLTLGALQQWIDEERRCVSAHLARVLGPDPDVLETLSALAPLVALAVVTNSARSRLDACLDSTGLSGLIPTAHRFSAEDSLPVPTGKPDPAVYVFALERLGCRPGEALAVEDSVPGARSAIAAGIRTVGQVAYVHPDERAERTASLEAAGVQEVATSWPELRGMLIAITPQTEPAPAD